MTKRWWIKNDDALKIYILSTSQTHWWERNDDVCQGRKTTGKQEQHRFLVLSCQTRHEMRTHDCYSFSFHFKTGGQCKTNTQNCVSSRQFCDHHFSRSFFIESIPFTKRVHHHDMRVWHRLWFDSHATKFPSDRLYITVSCFSVFLNIML
jgi:hypothetical protein